MKQYIKHYMNSDIIMRAYMQLNGIGGTLEELFEKNKDKFEQEEHAKEMMFIISALKESVWIWDETLYSAQPGSPTTGNVYEEVDFLRVQIREPGVFLIKEAAGPTLLQLPWFPACPLDAYILVELVGE